MTEVKVNVEQLTSREKIVLGYAFHLLLRQIVGLENKGETLVLQHAMSDSSDGLVITEQDVLNIQGKLSKLFFKDDIK